MPTTEEQLDIKQREIDRLKEEERKSFYAEVRASLLDLRTTLSETNKNVSSVQTWVTSMGPTTDIKATLDDYKIFKAQIKTGLIIMNVVWGIVVVLVNFFLKK